MDKSLLFTNTTPSTSIVKVKEYKYVRLDRTENGVAELVLCRPKQYNSMDDDFYNEFLSIFDEIQNDDNIKCLIIWGEGKGFTAGLNLSKAMEPIMGSGDDISQAKQNIELFKMIRRWQGSLDKINKCSKPVIAAIHGACIGGGVDLITACDIRLCSSDSKFSIRETKLAIVADLGTLQRIQKIVGNGFAREMALTGKDIDANTAARFGLVNNVYKDKDSLLVEARKMAQEISKNSPLVVQLTKLTLNHANDHSIDDGLYRVALQNAAFLKSDDLNEAGLSFFEKRSPIYKSNL